MPRFSLTVGGLIGYKYSCKVCSLIEPNLYEKREGGRFKSKRFFGEKLAEVRYPRFLIRRIIMYRRRIYVTCFIWLLATIPLVTHAQVENLALNFSFEEDEVILNDPNWESWCTWNPDDVTGSNAEIDETEFIDGQRSLRVEPVGTANWHFVVANISMPVKMGSNYTASFWVKAVAPRPLTAAFKAADNTVTWGETDFEVTTEWAEYSMTSESLSDELKLELWCAAVPDTFWLDFVYVYEGEYVAGISPTPPLKASDPNPANGAIVEQTWVTLSWTEGVSAVTHDVYLGDDYDDVSNATPDCGIFRGNQAATFFTAGFPGFPYPDGLVPGTTYYWRIDEVNEADPDSPWKGDVWSFSIPPQTAYNPDPADGAGIADTTATLTWTPGFGAKLHTVYFGDDYDQVNNGTVGIPVGMASYSPGPLETEKVYYWRVDEFDGVETHKGEVWTFTTPGAVGNPQPASGAVDVPLTSALSWTGATSATSHEVYLGLDKEAVRNADTRSPEYQGSVALGLESFDPGKLAWDTLCYWRVDAVYNAGPVKGPIWSFTTADFIVVDDFENYTDNDADGEAVWQSWIDGFGIADNGAQVGYLLPPYCEQTIVHGGSQSMPILYNNTAGVSNSEAVLTLTLSRDWTEEGVEELSLWFRGYETNDAEPLYMAASNTGGAPAVMAHLDPVAATLFGWTEWRIPLDDFAGLGINLTDVDKIAIGLGTGAGIAAPGGSGTLFIDDIRLYRSIP